MTDLSITALDELLGAGVDPANDLLVIVDKSDTTMALSGTDKKIKLTEAMRGALPGVLTYRGLVAPSTIYNPGDIVTLLDGRIVEMVLGATSSGASVIASSAYVLYVPQFYIIATGILYDSNPASAAANTVALQAALDRANPTGANAVGGKVLLSKGGFYTNAFIKIPNGVTLEGNSTFGTYWSLADGSNCSMVGPYISTGSGNANAFYWGLRDLSMDCRQAQQGNVRSDVSMTLGSVVLTSTATPWVNGSYVSGSGILPGTTISGAAGAGPYTANMSTTAQQTLTGATVYGGVSTQMYGVFASPNPLNSQQSGDWGFDPSGLIFNVVVKNSRDGAFGNFGRSANVYFRCKTSASLGIGFTGSFDSRYNSCESDFSAWHGFDFRGSSEQIVNCKSYNSGQVKTTAAAASNQAHGYVFNGFAGFGGIAFAGNDAQQNTGDAYRLLSCTSVTLAGCTASQVGFTSAVTTNVGYYFDNCDNCVVVGSCGVQPSNHCYAFVNGGTANTLITGFSGASKGSAALAGSSDTGNFIVVGGVAINAPGLVSSATVATAFARPYARQSSTGANFIPATAGAAGTAVLNRVELAPLAVPRAGMTCTSLTIRVASGVATAIVRCGLYTSSFDGSGDHTLLAELPSQFDASSSGVKTITFTSPIALDNTLMLWLAVVPQVVLSASFNGGVGNLVSTSNALGANYAIVQAGVSGALNATISFGVAGPPGGAGTGYLVNATLVG